jgi:hypothetical protein
LTLPSVEGKLEKMGVLCTILPKALAHSLNFQNLFIYF